MTVDESPIQRGAAGTAERPPWFRASVVAVLAVALVGAGVGATQLKLGGSPTRVVGGTPTSPVPSPTPTISPSTSLAGVTIVGRVYDARPLATNPNLVIPTDLSFVRGATVRIPGLNLAATSDSAGMFTVSGVVVQAPCSKFDFYASAPGFGNWVLRGVPVYPGGGPIVTIMLEAQPQTQVYTVGGAAAQNYRLCH